MRRAYAAWVVFGVVAALGCGGGSDDNGSTNDDTGTAHDSAVHDSGAGDSTIGDSTIGDSGAGDSAKTDSAKTDSTAADSVSGDSTASDTTTPTDTAVDDTTTPADTTPPPTDTSTTHAIKHVFVIMMENHDWSAIKGSSSAPYINGLLTSAAHAENYKTPAGNHPSEPNYIWLEAGDNLGITDDSDPSSNHQATTSHLVTQLETAGLDWRSYQESIDDSTCPLASEDTSGGTNGGYAPKHNPMVFFDDVTNTNKADAARCLAHVKDISKLATDLSAGTVAAYNFITPALCNDMHGSGTSGPCNNIPFFGPDLVKMGDDWLKANLHVITDSATYKADGAVFIIWDEGSASLTGSSGDGPMGMIVLSPFAKTNYSNSTAYTHSSTLKTIEEIFGLPLLRDAASAGTSDLSDFFTTFP